MSIHISRVLHAPRVLDRLTFPTQAKTGLEWAIRQFTLGPIYFLNHASRLAKLRIKNGQRCHTQVVDRRLRLSLA